MPALLWLVAGPMMPVPELAPFSSSIPGLAGLSLATSLLTRDGLFSLLGLPLVPIAAAIPVMIVGAACS